jgi:hypothetical protein
LPSVRSSFGYRRGEGKAGGVGPIADRSTKLRPWFVSKELRHEVRREKKPQPGGRPRGPELLKLTGRLVRAVRAADLAKLVKPAVLRQLDEKERERLMAELYTVRGALERIEDALAKR